MNRQHPEVKKPKRVETLLNFLTAKKISILKPSTFKNLIAVSAQTVAERLQIKPGMKISFFNPPEDLDNVLGPLPVGVNLVDPGNAESVDFMLAFIKDHRMLEDHLVSLTNKVSRKGALWLAYQKKSSTIDTDVSQNSISDYAHSQNIKAVAMISIDENWSGFRLKQI